MEMGVWGWDCGDESMGMGDWRWQNFSSCPLSNNDFFDQMISFGTLPRKSGRRGVIIFW